MRQRVACVLLTTVVLAVACDVPTSVPNWDMTWDFPANGATISVSSFLPSGVSLTPSGTTFQTTVTPITITRTLAQDCPQCVSGVPAPKPAFTSSTTSAPGSLPANVTGATLVADTAFVTIVNRYQFDPINPGAGAAGTMTLTVSSGPTVIGTLTLSGPGNTIPPNGATTTAKIPIAGAVTSAGVNVRVDVVSPQGSAITLSNTGSQQLTYTTRAGASAQGPITASSATVSLANQVIQSNPTDFSFEFGSADRADSASVFLTITNPFNLSGPLNVNFLGCVDASGNYFDSCPTLSAVLSRSVQLAPGTSTAVLHMGTPGAKALLNAKQIGFRGPMSGTTTVTPSQAVSVSMRVQVTMHTGSQ